MVQLKAGKTVFAGRVAFAHVANLLPAFKVPVRDPGSRTNRCAQCKRQDP